MPIFRTSIQTRSSAIVRRGLVVAAFAVAAGLAALVADALRTPQYSAEASLLFRDPGFGSELFGTPVMERKDADREAATNIRLVSLDIVAQRTADSLSGFSAEDIGDAVSVTADGRSDVVSITAVDPDPDVAALVANAFAESYIEFRRDADRQRVREARRIVQRELAALDPVARRSPAGRSLQRELSQLTALEALQTGNAELVQPAIPPDNPSSPKALRDALLAFVAGLIVGTLFQAASIRLDQRLREKTDVEAAFNLPVLGTVPRLRKLEGSSQHMGQLFTSFPEPFRMLRARLRYFNVHETLRTILFTSAAPSDGKTTIAWNFALSAAADGAHVLFIEADLHRPAVAVRESLAPLPGLAELLSNQAKLEGTIQTTRGEASSADPAPTLDVIVAGAAPPNPGVLIESRSMSLLLDTVSKEYDLVVLDTPPISMIADAIPLVRRVDGVIAVARLGHTTRSDAGELAKELSSLGAPVLGAIANEVRPADSYKYRYAYAHPSPQFVTSRSE